MNTPGKQDNKKIFFKTILCIIVLLAAFETAARLYLEKLIRPEYYEVRNPNFRRAWLEYISAVPPRDPERFRIIIISHSQAYGLELNSDKIYPTLLRRELSRLFPDNKPEVINWGAWAAKGPELTVLAANANLVEPDLILFIPTYDSYNAEFLNRRLSYFTNDVTHSALKPSILIQLPADFIFRHFGPKELFNSFLYSASLAYRYVPYYRYRLISSPRFSYTPLGKFMNKYFAYNDARHWVPAYHPERRPRAQPLPPQEAEAPEWTETRLDENGLKVMAETFEILARGKGKTVFAYMPYNAPYNEKRKLISPDSYALFDKTAKELCSRYGMERWDLHAAIDGEGFLDLAHLNESGHRKMAETLLPRLEKIISEKYSERNTGTE